MTVEAYPNTVVSLLATLIDVYREAATLLDHQKARCAQQRVAPPSRVLEENIDQAPEEIEKEKQRGLSRFGDQFELGDDDAVSQLQHIVALVQSELVDGLGQIADTDEEVDYTVLADAADAGRDGAITALLGLKRRLKEVESRKISIASTSQASDSSRQTSSTQEVTNNDDTTQLQTTGGADADKERPRRSHSNSLLGFFKHHRNRSGSEEAGLGRQRSFKRLSIHSKSSTPRSTSHEDQQEHDNQRDNSVNTRASAGSDTLQVPDERTSSIESMDSSHSGSTAHMRTSSSISASVRGPPVGTVQLTSDNDYLGFCKGAARLQTGDRQAMQRTKEFNDGWSSSRVYYLTCCNSKCAFASHLELDSIWTKVWLIEEIGIKFRWPFLAKSHITQTAKAKQSEYAYRCIFCVFLGLEASVIDGTDSYLEHVSEVHRDQAFGDIISYRTSCVAGRVCEDGEEFDINLFPLTGEEYTQRRLREQGEPLPDDKIDAPVSGYMATLEPVESDTPWCDDLPEFHQTDALEEIERQFSIRSFRSLSQG